MITDILNKSHKLVTDKKSYAMEFDNKAYGILEQRTGKSIFQIYDELIMTNSLGLEERIEIACCSMMKSHTTEEIERVREEFSQHQYLLMRNMIQITMAFIEPLTPPELLNKEDKPQKTLKKKRNPAGTNVPM